MGSLTFQNSTNLLSRHLFDAKAFTWKTAPMGESAASVRYNQCVRRIMAVPLPQAFTISECSGEVVSIPVCEFSLILSASSWISRADAYAHHTSTIRRDGAGILYKANRGVLDSQHCC
jgi:hypothetical protein